MGRVTLRPDSSLLPGPWDDGGFIYEVIEDFTSETLLSAMTSAGGLLAALQGIHILLFGAPLFYGIFGRRSLCGRQIISKLTFTGSKMLNPFGLLGNFSASRKDMIARYGNIPGTGGPSNGLALFLSDYVVNTSLLREEDDQDGTATSVRSTEMETVGTSLSMRRAGESLD